MDKAFEQFIHKNYNIIIEKKIGQGLTSKIYLCKPVNSLRKKVIKVYTFQEQTLNQKNAELKTKKNERLELQYQLQCKILELLKNKQDIVHAQFNGQYEKYGFIIMQYLQMRSLRDVHNKLIEKRDGKEQNTCKMNQYKKIIKIMLLKLLESLKTLSQNGVIHRDVKLENILFNSSYALKIIDFGSAKMIPGWHANTHPTSEYKGLINQILQLDQKLNFSNDFIVGSVNYLCPDLLAPRSHRTICSKIDVWALGILMYYLVYDSYPFKHQHESKLSMIITTIKTIQPDYPEDKNVTKSQKQIIKRCLQKDVHKRISIEQLLQTQYFKKIKKQIKQDTLKQLIQKYEFPEKFQKKLLYVFEGDNVQCWIEDHIHRQSEQQLENVSKRIKKYKNIKIYILQNQKSQRLLCTKSKNHLKQKKQQKDHESDDSDEQVWKLKKESMNIKIPIDNILVQDCKNNTLAITHQKQINNAQPKLKSFKFIFSRKQLIQELITILSEFNRKKNQL